MSDAGLTPSRLPHAAIGPGDGGAAARILEQGYQRYTGPRAGVPGAMRSVMVHTAQRALGIHRRLGAKVLPILTAVLAYLPAIAFVGISIFAKDQLVGGNLGFLPTYGEYYGYVWGAILLFTAFVAPGVLCTDRRNGMLGMYLASPLDRTTYLLSKAGAVGGVLGLATLGPPVLMLVAYTLNDAGPDGFTGFASVLGKVLVAGVLVTALHVSFSLAVASTTTRWAAASATIIVVFFASSVITGVLVRRGGMSPNLFVFDIVQLPFELVLRLFGERTHTVRFARNVETSTLIAAYAAWTLLFAAFTRWRYQRIEVTR